jgi:tetratricopeptide (TPR) repeat protein
MIIPFLTLGTASVQGTVVFPPSEGTPANRSIAFVRGNEIHAANIGADNRFALVGVPAGEYGVQLRNGNQTLIIASFTLEEGENQVQFYFPAGIEDQQRFARAQEAYAEGLRLLQAREYAFAENRLTESLQWDTGQPATWSALTLAQVGRRRYADALLSARMAAQLAPTEPLYQNNLGGVLFRMGNYDEAQKRFVIAANLARSGKGLFFANAGAACWRKGKEQEALTYYEQAVTDATVIPEAWFFYGVLCERLDNRGQARQAYTEYLSREPNGEWSAEARKRLQVLREGTS